jgi:hypothetical protein
MSNTTEDPMGDSPAATPTADPRATDATAADPTTAGTADCERHCDRGRRRPAQRPQGP